MKYKTDPLPLPQVRDGSSLLTPAEFARVSGTSLSTVWRRVRSGELKSIKRKGKRYIDATLVITKPRGRPLDENHPMWKMAGCARSGGAGPGSADKHHYLAIEAEARDR